LKIGRYGGQSVGQCIGIVVKAIVLHQVACGPGQDPINQFYLMTSRAAAMEINANNSISPKCEVARA